ncbi:MAG: trypsin-like peptidase domain-containing protein [Pirellulaceae bacterium]|nr:trypsin-like peptidase domain-containing protein [Pirellulaceae bacterium]
MFQNLIFSNPKLEAEFLDRFPELVSAAGVSGGLEGLDSIRFKTDDARRAVTTIQEGTGDPIDGELEAIIRRFGRPAYFVQHNTFDTTLAPSSSQEVNGIVNEAKGLIDTAIPRVGRINLRNHRKPWVGTGWVVARNVLVTNRHVVSEFAERSGDGYVFVETNGRTARAEFDTLREHGSGNELVFRLRTVLWIAPPANSYDVAFLSIDAQGENGESQPDPIDLMGEQELAEMPVERWTAVIGYPAFSPYNSAQDQQRIFEGIYDVKRMQPGQIMAKGVNGIVNHDATTLGGNSGSVVLDLTSGKAVALHFGGIEGDTNSAVAAPIVADLLRRHVQA